MTVPRKAIVSVTYARRVKVGKKTATRKSGSAVMAKYNEGFTYTDPATGESDTVSITLSNTDMRWANGWMPSRRDKLTAKIITRSWTKNGQKRILNCGRFCVDDLVLSGPELTCTIGGVSVPEGNAFRSTARNKTWKKVTLKEMARRIASRYHMKLDYIGDNINLESVEQSNETDCSFLRKVCSDYGMAIKVYSGKIIIYDKGVFEARKAIATLKASELQNWSYNETLVGTYSGARIKYTSGGNSKELICRVGSGKRILAINEKVDSLADARLKACGKVNAENEKAITLTATIMANPQIAAGSTVKVTGLKKINGKYFVDKVTHNIGADSAYTMDLELHKVQKRIRAYAEKKAKKTP